MSRQVKFISAEMGDLHIFAIWEKDGTWEGEWDILRGTKVGNLFSVVTQEAFTHALNKYHRPLVDQLGIPPAGALRKLPSIECALRTKCTFYEPRNCLVRASKMPHCFEPEGLEDEKVRLAAMQVISFWREAVYVVVVTA